MFQGIYAILILSLYKGEKMMKYKIKKIGIVIAGIIAALVIAFFIYVSDYYHAEALPVSSEQSTQKISYHGDIKSYIFEPKGDNKGGIIFYSGAKVDEKAYTGLMQKLAQQGYMCALVKMPFHLAIFDVNAADDIIAAYPNIENWYMMGHSLGGAMAADYVFHHENQIKGLVLLGAYSTQDLSKTSLQVLSFYGSEDQVLNREKYQNNFSNLPQNTKEYIIEGGNHANYGNYGEQSGDGKAMISSLVQQDQVVQLFCQVFANE